MDKKTNGISAPATQAPRLDPVAVVEVLMRQSKGTSRPGLGPDDILVRLEVLAPGFVHLVRGSGEYRTAMRSRS